MITRRTKRRKRKNGDQAGVNSQATRKISPFKSSRELVDQ